MLIVSSLSVRTPVIVATSLIVALAVTRDGWAQNQAPCTTAVLTLAEAASLLRVEANDLERLAQEGDVPGRRIGASWRFGCEALMDWLSGTVAAPDSGLLSPRALADVTARGTASQAAQSPGAPSGNSQDTPIGEAPEERTAEDVFLRGQRVLLGPGQVVLDVGQFYSRRDSLQLAAADGGVGLATLEQRALSTFLVGRVGILNETELFASTSFNRIDARQFLGDLTLGSSGDTAFGATGVGIRHTLVREGAGRPDVVLTLSGQIPNADTVAGVGGGLVLVKSVDPVVLFASANYAHAFEKVVSGEARLPPADAVDVSMGYGLGLNDTVAISMAVSGLFTRPTGPDGTRSQQPSVYSARFGLTSWLAEGLYIEPSISFGLNGPGDTFAFGVTLPFAF